MTKDEPKSFFKKSYFSTISEPHDSYEVDPHKKLVLKKELWLQPQSRT